MSQSAAIERVATGQITTGIILPHLSAITRISLLVTTAWGGGSDVLDIGMAYGVYPGPGVDINNAISPYDTDDLVDGWTSCRTLGNHVAGPAQTVLATVADVDNWMRIPRLGELGQTDRMIIFESNGSATDGRALITVNYQQAVDLSAIA
jgi:hypothetical protein